VERNWVRHAFNQQRVTARKRGIEFRLTYEEWCSWWKQQLGPDWFQLRGPYKGQYVMARYYDDGDYTLNNIKCVLKEVNSSETVKKGVRSPTAKLTEKQVRAIRIAAGKEKDIAAKFGISQSTVNDIKHRRRWCHLV